MEQTMPPTPPPMPSPQMNSTVGAGCPMEAGGTAYYRTLKPPSKTWQFASGLEPHRTHRGSNAASGNRI